MIALWNASDRHAASGTYAMPEDVSPRAPRREAPRLTIGLPVYNGEDYLSEALDSLLGQTFTDFELVVSDNASTDATAEICQAYAAQDDRVRVVRHPVNLGCGPNHNFPVEIARGELFKWASDDDLYAADLVAECIKVLDEHRDVILSHSWSGLVDADGTIVRQAHYDLRTDSPDPVVRFRSILFDVGGDDDYGVIRTDVLRRVRPYDSYWRADRVLPAELALHGRFLHVPRPLFFRRDHPGSLSHQRSVRQWCSSQDPRRADRRHHPLPRLVAEYPLGYLRAIANAPLTVAERARCLAALGHWAGSRVVLAASGEFGAVPPVPTLPGDQASVHDVIPRAARRV